MATAAVIGAVTGHLLKKLIALATDGIISSSWHLKADLKKLIRKLTMIQALLRDADRGHPQSAESLSLWLSKIRGLAYDAEDVLDVLASESLRHKLELKNHMKSKVKNFFLSSNPVLFHFKMVREVSKINRMLNELTKEANDFGLRPLNSSPSPAPVENYRPSHPFLDAKIVVGRDAEMLKVVDMLVSSNDKEELPVVAIVGMAGLGKTTVAQLAYNHEAVRRRFKKQMWVCVSVNFDAKRLLNEMIESLCGVSSNFSSTEAAVMKLRETLQGESYLLVLDDVWNTDIAIWESARNALLGLSASWQSKIVVTSRSFQVATTMKVFPFVLELKGLSESDSWSLFRQKAFAVGGADENPTMEAIGKMIVGKCKGVPLAINAVAAVMNSKKTDYEWVAVQNSELWSLPEDTSQIFPALMLSFYYLPSPSIKQCFVYCSIFPKDFVMEKSNLIQLWMAQGFLQPSKGRYLEMEDTGSEYFDTLLRNSFLQDPRVDQAGNIVSCKMHDLVHDLAQSISGSEVVIIDQDYEWRGLTEVCHLSMMTNGDWTKPTVQSEYSQKLRTLFIGENADSNMLLNSNCLRGLSLRGSGIEKLPVLIDRLKHLRYLDISNTRLEVLPNSVTRLYNLQTLRMDKCSSLKELPRGFCNLINLRHLSFDYQVQVPTGIGNLKDLQTLPFFAVLRVKGCGIEELGSLKKLRGRLHIRNLEYVSDKEEAERACLEEKSLYELGLQWGSDQEEVSNNSEVVLEGLRPHPWLKSLTVDGFMGGKFSAWLPMLEKMAEIQLKDCKNCVLLPSLGILPCLEVLQVDGLVNVTCIGSELYSMDGAGSSSGDARRAFPALRTFSLENMLELLEWRDPPAAAEEEFGKFPCLEKLIISNCPQLAKAPSHFPCLKKLSIYNIGNGALANICSSTELKTLTSFSICNVSGLSSFPDGLLQNNKNLTYMAIDGCDELLNVWPRDDNLYCCTSLRFVQITNCRSLEYIAGKLKGLSSLDSLWISNCHNLGSLPDMEGVTSLQDLTVMECKNLTGLPSGLPSCRTLRGLSIVNCSNKIILSLPVEKLTYLDKLDLGYCGEIKCLPEGLQKLTQLKMLGLGGFDPELDDFPSLSSIRHILPSLEVVILTGWPKLKNLPEEMQLLSAVRELRIHEFDGVEALPEWLAKFTSLESLHLCSWEKLECLPESLSVLSKLQMLCIVGSPLLKDRCTKHSGEDWRKISHIPRININDNWIRYRGNTEPIALSIHDII